MSSLARESPAVAAPRGATRPARTDRDPAPRRPPPSRSGRPPARPTPPLPTLVRLRAAVAPTPPSDKGGPHARADRAAGAKARRAAPGLGARRGASMLPARAGAASPAPSRSHSPRGRPEATYFWGRRPPDSLWGKRKLSRRLPSVPLASRTCEAPPRSREGGCAPARVRPVALSSSSFHYIIFSFSEGWAGAGGLGREGTFATFLHSFSSSTPPPPPSSLGKTMVRDQIGEAGRLRKAVRPY